MTRLETLYGSQSFVGFWYTYEISLHLRMCPIGKTYSLCNTFPNTFETYSFTLIDLCYLQGVSSLAQKL